MLGLCVWHGGLVQVKGRWSGVGDHLLTCSSRGSNLDHLAWPQAPLPTELHRQPPLQIFSVAVRTLSKGLLSKGEWAKCRETEACNSKFWYFLFFCKTKLGERGILHGSASTIHQDGPWLGKESIQLELLGESKSMICFAWGTWSCKDLFSIKIRGKHSKFCTLDSVDRALVWHAWRPRTVSFWILLFLECGHFDFKDNCRCSKVVYSLLFL